VHATRPAGRAAAEGRALFLASGDLAETTGGRAHAQEAGTGQVTADPRVKQLEREKASLETDTRRLERRLQRAETIIAFQKKVAELLGIPLKPFEADEIE
jgi:hypothetical protein